MSVEFEIMVRDLIGFADDTTMCNYSLPTVTSSTTVVDYIYILTFQWYESCQDVLYGDLAMSCGT